MNKQKVGRKFHRKRDQRGALLKSLARNLIVYKKIQTTEAKAKELRPFVEKLVTRAQKKTLSDIRYLKTYFDDTALFKLIHEVAPKYAEPGKERAGGYTRIIKTVSKGRQAAKSAIIEFV